MAKKILPILIGALFAHAVFAQNETALDSLYNRFQIEEVEVTARALTKDVIIPQTLKGAELQRLNELSVAVIAGIDDIEILNDQLKYQWRRMYENWHGK